VNLTTTEVNEYFCLLDHQPTHLVPVRLLGRYPNPEGTLSVNSLLSWQPPTGLMPENGWQAMSQCWPVGWVPDAHTALATPYWVSTELKEILECRHGSRLQFGNELIRTLYMANVITNMASLRIVRQKWLAELETAAAEFRRREAATISALIPSFHVGALRRYYRRRLRRGLVGLGDRQSDRRYVAHNDPIAKFFHQALTPVVSRIVGCAVKPSYVYLASYLGGANLPEHTDRVQCEYSVSLLVDFAPEPTEATPWPLYLKTPQRYLEVRQAIGDSLVYRGSNLPHLRLPLNEHMTSTSVFFHYVDEGFDGNLN
jgi:hypothetical protein